MYKINKGLIQAKSGEYIYTYIKLIIIVYGGGTPYSKEKYIYIYIIEEIATHKYMCIPNCIWTTVIKNEYPY